MFKIELMRKKYLIAVPMLINIDYIKKYIEYDLKILIVILIIINDYNNKF